MALDPLLVSRLALSVGLSGYCPGHYPSMHPSLICRRGQVISTCYAETACDLTFVPPLNTCPPFRVRVGMVDRCVQWWFLGDVSGEGKRDEVLGWQWHQLDHMQTVGTLLQTDNSASTRHSIFTDQILFLISWCPTNSVKALKTVIWAE